MPKLFITGTDTGVGKTYVSVGLLKTFNQQGLSTVALKPVASGCQNKNGKLYNSDTLALQQSASIKIPSAMVTPFAFEPAIAPHLAAEKMGMTLTVDKLKTATNNVLNYHADIHLIEGVGGWLVPLNNKETMADFVIQQQLSVILVVDIRLGCLNHTLLTYRAMQNDRVRLIGWIANCTGDAIPVCEENIATLKEWLSIPCLGSIQCGQDICRQIDVGRILLRESG